MDAKNMSSWLITLSLNPLKCEFVVSKPRTVGELSSWFSPAFCGVCFGDEAQSMNLGDQVVPSGYINSASSLRLTAMWKVWTRLVVRTDTKHQDPLFSALAGRRSWCMCFGALRNRGARGAIWGKEWRRGIAVPAWLLAHSLELRRTRLIRVHSVFSGLSEHVVSSTRTWRVIFGLTIFSAATEYYYYRVFKKRIILFWKIIAIYLWIRLGRTM